MKDKWATREDRQRVLCPGRVCCQGPVSLVDRYRVAWVAGFEAELFLEGLVHRPVDQLVQVRVRAEGNIVSLQVVILMKELNVTNENLEPAGTEDDIRGLCYGTPGPNRPLLILEVLELSHDFEPAVTVKKHRTFCVNFKLQFLRLDGKLVVVIHLGVFRAVEDLLASRPPRRRSVVQEPGIVDCKAFALHRFNSSSSSSSSSSFPSCSSSSPSCPSSFLFFLSSFPFPSFFRCPLGASIPSLRPTLTLQTG